MPKKKDYCLNLEETSKLFSFFINKMDGLSTNQFQGVHKNDIPTVEVLKHFLGVLNKTVYFCANKTQF